MSPLAVVGLIGRMVALFALLMLVPLLFALADHYPAGQIPYEVSYRQGLSLRSLGRYRESAECLAAAARQPAPSADLLYDLARSQILAGDKLGATQTTAAALRLKPDHAPSLNLQQELAGQQGQMAAMGDARLLR